MRLLTAPTTSLVWQDVLDFCGLELPESTTLDYKRDIPSELDRTVSAMANTSGGVILIGVDEDRTTTKPILPPIGVPLARGLGERITNICITNIAPLLVPETAVVPDVSGNRAVIVVRIPQSHQAPHAVSRNTKVYLRRGSINSPEDLASLNEIDWLRSGRQKSADFREALYRGAQDRFFQFLRGFEGSNAKPPQVESDGMLSLAFYSSYPKEMLAAPPDLRAVLPDIRIHDYYGTDYEFPLGSLNGKVVQDGFIVHASVNGGEWVHHTELNAFGLLFFRQSLLHPVQLPDRKCRIMRASEIFCRLDEMFDCATKFFQRVKFTGSLHFRMRLENLVGFPLGKYSTKETGFDLSFTPDNIIDFIASVSSSSIQEEKSAFILAAARRVAWAFDWDVHPTLLNKYYTRYKGEKVIHEESA
jgi:Putative DNA-binding domain